MNKEIEKIFLGIPTEYSDRILKVADEFRTNPLSKKGGGYDIVIVYKQGDVLLYDKIKFPYKYINAVLSFKMNIDNLEFSSVESYISTELEFVFIKQDETFEKIWDNKNFSGEEFLKLLQKLEEKEKLDKKEIFEIYNPIGTLEDRVKIILTQLINKNHTYFKLIEKDDFTIYLEVSRIFSIFFNTNNRNEMLEIFDDLFELDKEKKKNDLDMYVVDFKERIPDFESRMRVAFVSLFEGTGIVIGENNEIIREIEIDYSYYRGTFGKVYPEEIYINGKRFITRFEEKIW